MIENPVNLLGLNGLAIWKDVVLGAELEHLLGVGDTSDEGTGDGFSLRDEFHLTNVMGLYEHSELNKSTALSKKRQVMSTFVRSSNCVQDEVARGSLSIHGGLVS